jgi:hypothetical protein
MKIHITAFLAAACLLSACSDQDWNHALSYTGLSHDEPSPEVQSAASAAPTPMTAHVTAAPASVAAADAPAGPNAFCASVASQDSQTNDFDPATQRRVFVQSYQQCVTVFGDVTK